MDDKPASNSLLNFFCRFIYRIKNFFERIGCSDLKFKSSHVKIMHQQNKLQFFTFTYVSQYAY